VRSGRRPEKENDLHPTLTGPSAQSTSPPGLPTSRPHERRKTGILYVNTTTRPPLGADVWLQAQIMKGLDRSRFDLHTACALGPAEAPTPTYELLRTIPALKVHPVNFGTESKGPSLRAKARNLVSAFGSARSIVGLAWLIRRNGVGIIHTTDRPRDAFVSILLSRVTRARAIVHVHVGYADWMSPLRKWSIRKAGVLVTVSEFVKESLVSSGHDARRIHAVLNGIDIDNWPMRTPNDVRRVDVRREMGLSDDTPVILTVCRLFPSKGAADLIRAAAALVDEIPEVRLIVVGGESQPGYRSELEKLASDLSVESNVIFAGWRSDVQRLMAAADVFAMPSIGEPFGLVYLEAMAIGLPVVALDSGGTAESVEHGVTGLLSPEGDPDALTANLKALLRSPELRMSMGRRGRESVEKYFTTERVARDMESIYERTGP
jgi:glycosyltransferase involved in cell wall biosynthesis